MFVYWSHVLGELVDNCCRPLLHLPRVRGVVRASSSATNSAAWTKEEACVLLSSSIFLRRVASRVCRYESKRYLVSHLTGDYFPTAVFVHQNFLSTKYLGSSLLLAPLCKPPTGWITSDGAKRGVERHVVPLRPTGGGCFGQKLLHAVRKYSV